MGPRSGRVWSRLGWRGAESCGRFVIGEAPMPQGCLPLHPCDPCWPQAIPAGRRPSLRRGLSFRSAPVLHSAPSLPRRGCRSLHHYPRALFRGADGGWRPRRGPAAFALPPRFLGRLRGRSSRKPRCHRGAYLSTPATHRVEVEGTFCGILGLGVPLQRKAAGNPFWLTLSAFSRFFRKYF